MTIEALKIPKSLTELRQWCVWKMISRPGDVSTKVPFQIDGSPASTTNPQTWTSFDLAYAAYRENYSGIGFIFNPSDPFCGIDFDACRDKQSGKLSDWAAKWIKKLNSYSEISPSGTGVKVWIKAKNPLPNGKKKILPQFQNSAKAPAIEVYDFGRFFAMTGWRYDKLPPEPQDRQDVLDELIKEYFGEQTQSGNGHISNTSSSLSIIERARKYLDTIPPAVSGSGGHDQTFKAACILVLGFGLSQTESLILMSEYNQRCQPKWTEKELRHKIESADKQAGERGYLSNKKETEWKSVKIPDYKETEYKQPEPKSFTELSEGSYKLDVPDDLVCFEISRLRRESHELIGELCVKCHVPGIKTYDGSLSIADFNLSSARARSDRAKLLLTRANVEGIDWLGHLEEFCQRVLNAERRGQSAVDLRTLSKTVEDDSIYIKGIKLPKRHPAILFGDGGSAKSYVALYFAGRLANDGLSVALFDWELAGEDHRDRLERMFGKIMPKVIYARCERPLIYEIDRLRRIILDEKIDYAIFDSVAFACSGPPESAEIAGAYFRALRQINCGSLHIAHVTKAFEGADQKPFGSVFFHNGARATYYVKLADDSSDIIHLGIFNRKSNLGRLQPPVGFKIEFTNSGTFFVSEDPSGTPEIASKMSVKDRLKSALANGQKNIEDLAENLDVPRDTIYKAIKRNNKTFVLLDGGLVGRVLDK